MLLEGTIREGKVVFDKDSGLSEGTRVEVVTKPTVSTVSNPQLAELLLSYAGKVTDWPADMAANHDLYLHSVALLK